MIRPPLRESAVRIIPVIDILHGRVVHGVAGQRERYAPIRSQLTDSSAPNDIVAAIRQRFSYRDLYIADLDVIQGRAAAYDLYSALRHPAGTLMIDAGVNSPVEAEALLAQGASQVIVGLESCSSPERLRSILSAATAGCVTFSLDLQSGQSLGGLGWPSDPMEIATTVLDCGIRSLIVLDLAGVGVAQGVPTLPLCRRIRTQAPTIELITGGGVRHAADLAELETAGVDGVLIATALHQVADWLPGQ